MASLGVKHIYVGDLKPMEQVTLTIELHGLRGLRLRQWFGKKLIAWGVKIIGCKLKVVEINH